jgi:hypothetical protein
LFRLNRQRLTVVLEDFVGTGCKEEDLVGMECMKDFVVMGGAEDFMDLEGRKDSAEMVTMGDSVEMVAIEDFVGMGGSYPDCLSVVS